MRSVTWRSTCSAVAPGQSVRITMARKAKSGSSRWPSWKYAAMPPAAITARKKSVSCRYLSAAAERLKSLFIEDAHALARAQELRAGGDHHVAGLQAGLDHHELAGDAAGLHLLRANRALVGLHHEHLRVGAARVQRGDRHLDIARGGGSYLHGGAHAELDLVPRLEDRGARGIHARHRVGGRRQLAQLRLPALAGDRVQIHRKRVRLKNQLALGLGDRKNDFLLAGLRDAHHGLAGGDHLAGL